MNYICGIWKILKIKKQKVPTLNGIPESAPAGNPPNSDKQNKRS